MKTNYNPWPLGKLPENWVRPEIAWAKNRKYFENDPRELVELFERSVADYCGAPYAVAVDCCSNGIFLVLQYLLQIGKLQKGQRVIIPNQTYASVPMQIIHAGLIPVVKNLEWSGVYEIGENLDLFDCAARFTQNMYRSKKGFQVLSFQIKKILPIGRGGMILLEDEEAYKWLKLARHDGRDLSTKYDQENHLLILGWHFYMTPEDAARGLQIFEQLPLLNSDSMNFESYPKLSDYNIFSDLEQIE